MSEAKSGNIRAGTTLVLEELILLNLSPAGPAKMSQLENGVRPMIIVTDAKPDLSISLDKVCFFVLKAREFDVKDVVTDPDSGSNPSDDGMISVLEDHNDDPTQQELRSFIDALTEDEQIDLVALTWLGRGDGTIDDWEDLRAEAARLHNNRTAAYLLGKPMLADHLQEGLAQLGCSCEE
jgi:hypothetical protein